MKKIWTLCAMAVLAGCASNAEPLGPDFGNAVQFNKSAHIINPAPVYDSPFGETDGVRSALGMERYRTGTVIVPRELTTTGGF